ncbi:hypothetical protein [Alcanivorax sp.]|uniref:hypothetical protein n=1 Tax=Alcanivorax sp. TaxID=1872427 RepID=UPI0032D93273
MSVNHQEDSFCVDCGERLPQNHNQPSVIEIVKANVNETVGDKLDLLCGSVEEMTLVTTVSSEGGVYSRSSSHIEKKYWKIVVVDSLGERSVGVVRGGDPVVDYLSHASKVVLAQAGNKKQFFSVEGKNLPFFSLVLDRSKNNAYFISSERFPVNIFDEGEFLFTSGVVCVVASLAAYFVDTVPWWPIFLFLSLLFFAFFTTWRKENKMMRYYNKVVSSCESLNGNSADVVDFSIRKKTTSDIICFSCQSRNPSAANYCHDCGTGFANNKSDEGLLLIDEEELKEKKIDVNGIKKTQLEILKDYYYQNKFSVRFLGIFGSKERDFSISVIPGIVVSNERDSTIDSWESSGCTKVTYRNGDTEYKDYWSRSKYAENVSSLMKVEDPEGNVHSFPAVGDIGTSFFEGEPVLVALLKSSMPEGEFYECIYDPKKDKIDNVREIDEYFDDIYEIAKASWIVSCFGAFGLFVVGGAVAGLMYGAAAAVIWCGVMCLCFVVACVLPPWKMLLNRKNKQALHDSTRGAIEVMESLRKNWDNVGKFF